MRLDLQTDRVPQDDRVDYWRWAMRTGLGAECDVEPAPRSRFAASMRVLPCGPLTLVELAGNPFKTTRRGAGAPDWVSIKVQIDGVGAVSDHRRTARLGPGDLCLVPPDREIVAERASAFRQVLVNVPIPTLERAVPAWRELLAVTLEANRPQARPVVELLRLIFDHHALLSDASRDHLAATALQLLGGLLAGAPPPPPPRRAAPSRMAAFQRQRVERWILDHLRDPELRVDSVARALGLSRRYVHKLFEDQPLNVMQWTLAQRLAGCQRDLARRDGRSVGEVAYGWGFNSLSHFSRVFKQHYGVRPTQI